MRASDRELPFVRRAAEAFARAFALAVLLLLGCGPRPEGATGGMTPHRAAKPAASAPPAMRSGGPLPTAQALAPSPACELRLAADAIAGSKPGPVFALVNHGGVLRIDEQGASVVKPVTRELSPWGTSLVARPDGELWASDWSGVAVLGPAPGAVRALRAGKGGPLFEQLAVRSPTDAWAKTSDSEWALVHFDGKSWSVAAERRRFAGRYEDNKLDSLVVTSEGVWVSTWNGVWRGTQGTWVKIATPGDARPSAALFVYRDKPLAASFDGVYLWESDAWRKLAVPAPLGRVWAVSDLGLIAGGGDENRRVVLASLTDPSCVIASSPLRGGVIHDIEIDGSGRLWVATELGLSVLDSAARVLGDWPLGTLDGLVGEVWRLSVASAGPARLPPPVTARRFDVIGRMVTYKSGAALANASLELCAGGNDERGCAGAPFVRRTIVDVDGTFRFQDVQDGDFYLQVRPPAKLADCEGIFSEMRSSVTPAVDCTGWAEGGRVCDLGTIRQCLPFELPPPRKP